MLSTRCQAEQSGNISKKYTSGFDRSLRRHFTSTLTTLRPISGFYTTDQKKAVTVVTREGLLNKKTMRAASPTPIRNVLDFVIADR